MIGIVKKIQNYKVGFFPIQWIPMSKVLVQSSLQ
jgi:hypothetical protein